MLGGTAARLRNWDDGNTMEEFLKSAEPGRPRVFGVDTVSDFVKLATWIYSSQEVLFRGQTKEAGWPLVPGVGRYMDRSKFYRREEEILQEFKRESIPYLQVSPRNNWQWLAVAQHNRLPTRLLDWTRNPLAALWFAVCEPAIEEQPGVVWALSREIANVVTNSENISDPFAIDKLYVYYPEHVFQYIRAQSGVFTAHPRGHDDLRKFSPLEEAKDADLLLSKIQIPADAFSTARYHLFKLGVSPASMFPGLHGLVDRIRYDNILSEDEHTIGWPPNPGNRASG